MQTLNIIYAKRNQLKSIKILNLRVCLVLFPPHLQPHLFLLQYLSFLNLRTNDGLDHLFLCSCLQQFADYFSSRLAHPLGSIDIKQSARRMIQRYTQEAMIEIHITPHMFRHAFATLLLEEEVDIRFIQKMLGHASIMTTQIYAEVALKKQMEILKMKHPRNRMEILEKNVEMGDTGVV